MLVKRVGQGMRIGCVVFRRMVLEVLFDGDNHGLVYRRVGAHGSDRCVQAGQDALVVLKVASLHVEEGVEAWFAVMARKKKARNETIKKGKGVCLAEGWICA